MLPHIYLAQTPTTAHARRVLRARALDLAARLRRVNEGPCYALLNIAVEAAELPPADMLLLRPRSLLIGLLKEHDGPLDLGHGHPWLGEARRVREAVLERLALAEHMPHNNDSMHVGTPVAALILSPALSSESRITLDIDDHRQRIKLLGLDELAPLVSMLQAGAHLDEAAMQAIAQRLDARLWHDGERLRFEIGRAPFVLRVLAEGEHSTLPLLEGANVVGRRSAPLQHEYRLTLEGDDSVSADHAIVICGADERVTLRDTSTNGSYVRTPDGDELRIHHAERVIVPGTVLRMGETELRLEPA